MKGKNELVMTYLGKGQSVAKVKTVKAFDYVQRRLQHRKGKVL